MDEALRSRLNPTIRQPEDTYHLLEAIVRSSDDAIITKDLDGRVTSWNPAAERIFGYTAEEMTGQSITLLIPEYLQHEEPMILSKLRAGEQVRHFETTRVRKDGREICVSLTISPIKNAEGKVLGVSKIARDITEQKQQHLARIRLSAIVESAEDAIVSKDLNGIVTSWNNGAQRIFGYTEDEIVGASILTLIPRELHPEETTILSKIRAGERVEHFESTRLTKDGRKIEVSLTISPLRDDSGKVIGASKIARDISDRRQIERSLLQAEKLAASGKMAATIAHEINNPLESLLNLVYLARTSASEPQVADYLLSAESEIERLAHIAKQTLGFYREQNGARPISLAVIAADTLRVYERRLNSAGVKVETCWNAKTAIVMRRGEMMQVISNLVTNAAYSMPNGGKLIVSLEEQEKQGRAGQLLSVQDTGGGIPPENLKRVFEPFFTTRSAIGTGIGLWIARKFVEGHGGSIQVESSIDPVHHGTRFTIWLPLETGCEEGDS